jgi:hypothetical protein
VKKLSIYGALPDKRYDSIQDTINTVAPAAPGIIFFWDKEIFSGSSKKRTISRPISR